MHSFQDTMIKSFGGGQRAQAWNKKAKDQTRTWALTDVGPSSFFHLFCFCLFIIFFAPFLSPFPLLFSSLLSTFPSLLPPSPLPPSPFPSLSLVIEAQ